MPKLKITIIAFTDADSSSVLDAAIELCPQFERDIGKSFIVDDNDVSVEEVEDDEQS